MKYSLPLLALLLLLAVTSGCATPVAGQAAPEPVTYVAIGASDTVGVGAAQPDSENWPAVLHRRLPGGSRLVNLGVSGSLLGQALDQQLPVALTSDPDLVTVWLSVNDYGARVPLDRYTQQLDRLLGELRANTRAAILVGNIPDLSALPVASRFDLRHIEAWNAAIEEVSQRHGATVVDLRATWSEVREHPEYLSSDGFHPSTIGYARLADLFYAAAAPALAP